MFIHHAALLTNQLSLWVLPPSGCTVKVWNTYGIPALSGMMMCYVMIASATIAPRWLCVMKRSCTVCGLISLPIIFTSEVTGSIPSTEVMTPLHGRKGLMVSHLCGA
ncbi:unnamed protein product [Choristocarpus tenellus]